MKGSIHAGEGTTTEGGATNVSLCDDKSICSSDSFALLKYQGCRS